MSYTEMKILKGIKTVTGLLTPHGCCMCEAPPVKIRLSGRLNNLNNSAQRPVEISE